MINNEIKKSLFDKSVESFNYNPKIVVNNKSKSIKNKIIENLENSSRFDIAVSYVVWSGLSLIKRQLKNFTNESRLILTTEGIVTDPRSLRELLKMNIQVKVFNPFIESKGFHLKSYMFEGEKDVTLLIGSNNISARAFGLVHEMAMEVSSSKDGYIVYEYQNSFEEIWNSPSAVDLNEDFIKEYQEVYNYKSKMDKFYAEYNLEENIIKPNYMQKKALLELENTREYSNYGLVIAATGTGKTYLAAFDVEKAKPNKMLFLVHNRLILTSAIKTFKRVIKNKRIIELNSSNIDQIQSADLIFTTDKTAFNHLYLKYSKDYFDYIVYDEAHKIGAETKYKDLISYFKPKFSLGITATPERTDNPKYLFETFKYSIPYEIRLLDSMEYELVCPFTYYGLNLDSKLLDTNEKFNYKELARFLKDKINDKGHYGEKLRAILFASDISEAISISNALRNEGYNSVTAVSTNSDNEQIEKYINSLKSDEDDTVEIICTVNKFNEGVDIPDINMIIMLRNTTSSIIYLQQLGRGLRKTEDPEKFVTVLDIIGNSKNNYTIAEVLTGNQTKDKRILYKLANNGFEEVSPFINVDIEKKAIDNIIKSISNNFTVKTKLKNKFRDELYRYKIIPSLKELYLDKVFNELELLQLLYKNFYEPFEEYYAYKYDTMKDSLFLRNFFTLIMQFVFRGYNANDLFDYSLLLRGESITNKTLESMLFPKESTIGRSTAINSNYKSKVDVYPFILKNNQISFNPKIINMLKEAKAYQLFLEHIELIEEIAKRKSYQMQPFDLVDKGEFLFNSGAKDCYMNVVGERIDKTKKAVYCAIKITEGKSHYDNYIIDNDKIVYYTQTDNSIEKAEEKIRMFLEDKYVFYICAVFPHLGYSNTSYFNLGDVTIDSISEVLDASNNKFNHKIVFKLKESIPIELMQYKEL